MLKSFAPLLIGFLVTITMMLVLRPLAVHLRLIDVPGGRKTHAGDVPVIGGIAIFLGLLAAVQAIDPVGRGDASLLVAAGLMCVVGSMDDRFDLPPHVRILAHIAAVMTFVLASGYTVESLGNLLGLGSIGLGPLEFVFTVVAAIALINGLNMLDGLDGLAGGVALIAVIGLSIIFATYGPFNALVVSLALVGSLTAFLIFNLPAAFNRPVLVFMGDAGSTLLGFLLAGLALFAVQPDNGRISPVIILWLLPVPILELFTSTFRRAVTGLSPMTADRGHFHYRLLDAGFSVRSVFILYIVTSAISALVGICAWAIDVSDTRLFFGFLGFSAVWLLCVGNAKRIAVHLPKSLKRRKFHTLRRQPRGSADPASAPSAENS